MTPVLCFSTKLLSRCYISIRTIFVNHVSLFFRSFLLRFSIAQIACTAFLNHTAAVFLYHVHAESTLAAGGMTLRMILLEMLRAMRNWPY